MTARPAAAVSPGRHRRSRRLAPATRADTRGFADRLGKPLLVEGLPMQD